MSDSDRSEPDRSLGDGVTRVPGVTGITELVGRKFGLYTLEELLAEGGQGAVYRARDGLGKLRAVKVVPRQALAGAEERLVRESDALESLRHPNVVAFHACDVEGDFAWLAMQYVDGESVAQCVRRGGPLAEADAIGILEDVLRGLGAAHAAGIIHRDLSANNVLIERETGRALLTDFGLARGDQLGHSLTATGAVVGTGAYIAPEVFEGEKAGPAADLWGIGVLACHLATGTAPFRATSWVAMMRAVCDKPPDLSRLDDCPALAPLVRACLVKDPDRRVQSAELAIELLREDAVPEPRAERPSPAAKPVRKPPPKRPRREPKPEPSTRPTALRWIGANVAGWSVAAIAGATTDARSNDGVIIALIAIPIVLATSQLIGWSASLGKRWWVYVTYALATPIGWVGGIWGADWLDYNMRSLVQDPWVGMALTSAFVGAAVGLAQMLATLGRAGWSWPIATALGFAGAFTLPLLIAGDRHWIDELRENFWWTGPLGGASIGLATLWHFRRLARRTD